MRRLVAAACAGIAGAVTLTLLHQLGRTTDRSPSRLDRLDDDSLRTLLRKLRLRPRSPDRLHRIALMSQLLVNSGLYSSLFARQPRPWLRGAIGGTIVGMAVALIGPALYTAGTARTMETRRAQALTIAMYSSAGLVASALYSALARRRLPPLYTQSLPIDRAAL
jgi:hypothetical protein